MSRPNVVLISSENKIMDTLSGQGDVIEIPSGAALFLAEQSLKIIVSVFYNAARFRKYVLLQDKYQETILVRS